METKQSLSRCAVESRLLDKLNSFDKDHFMIARKTQEWKFRHQKPYKNGHLMGKRNISKIHESNIFTNYQQGSLGGLRGLIKNLPEKNNIGPVT